MRGSRWTEGHGEKSKPEGNTALPRKPKPLLSQEAVGQTYLLLEGPWKPESLPCVHR